VLFGFSGTFASFPKKLKCLELFLFWLNSDAKS